MKLGEYSRHLVKLGVLVACFLTIFASSCTSDDPPKGNLAEGCLINSDCASPLVCAFRRCHTACDETRDCPAGQRCVASDRPFHVCQLEIERTCVYNTDCPVGQVCGVDAQCRDRCMGDADCVSGQRCISRTCAEPSELRNGTLPGVDGGPSTGKACSYNSQCPDRLVCRKGACQLECLSATDCPEDRQCVGNRCQVRVCPEIDAGAGVVCAFSSECPAPLVCRGGGCTCECRSGGDCPSGFDCVSNRCAPSKLDAVGPEGGFVISPDRRLTLEVPPGALTARVELTIELAEAWPRGALGPVFEVRPSGTTFAVPATFVYRYEPEDIAPFAAAGVRLAVASGASWSRLSTTVNPTARTATATTTHLSTYGLVSPESTPDGGVDAGDAGAGDASRDGGDAGGCAQAACSGTARDGCCPAACTASTDSDCAGCGNGRLDPGETCDPPGSCPACDDQNDCTTETQTGSAAACNVVCEHAAKTCSNGGKDKCCPIGCTASTDSDCAGCGDGVIDPTAGETCDPPGSCPTSCPAGQCWEIKTYTGSPATCNARCSTTQRPCSGAGMDNCCPPGCNTSPSNRDVDCPAMCGNGVIDADETCDPLSSCPTACPQQGCDLRSLVNGGTCKAACQISGAQTACASGDACCPSGCNANTDTDCGAVCGNGVIEPGEHCEGASCPTSCPNQACAVRALMGSGCQRQCVDAGTIGMCVSGDGCCPSTCTALQDSDCAGCGNGRLESGETCDPPGSCPVCDDQNDCTADTQTGSAATCNVTCLNTAKTCSTAGKDKCCPSGCTAQTDSDCAGCGDGVIDPAAGETCDPPSSCPTACPAGQCWEITALTGSAATCNVRCSTTQRACSGTAADRCCPPGCNTSPSNRDVDCPAMCGNGIVDQGETCDPLTSCPMTCPQQGCNLRTLVNGGTCQAACQISGTQGRCDDGLSDGCCPGSCNANNDGDCAPVCGNAVVEKGEDCDGNCPTACPQVGCQLRTLTGAGCQRRCVAAGAVTTCSARASDACCPANCNANSDSDCSPVCGNGVVESGETCDLNCPTASSCASDVDTLRTLTGTATKCDVVCTETPRPCDSKPDGFCPSRCSAANDPDCSPVNDKCTGAIDISDGGSFTVDVAESAKQDAEAKCSAAGPEVFYGFKLEQAEFVYLSALDNPISGNAVPVALEVYADKCPDVKGTAAAACDAGAGGERACARPPFPLVSSSNNGVLSGKPLGPGQFFVAVRAVDKPGRWTLTYHHVPLLCAAQSELIPGTQIAYVDGNTCNAGDNSAPACAASEHGLDANYAVYKCPGQMLAFTTCNSGRGVGTDDILSAVFGSVTYDAKSALCAAGRGGKQIACAVPAATCGPNLSRAANFEIADKDLVGLFTVNVDTHKTGGCAGYTLGHSRK